MQALVFEKKEIKYALSKVASQVSHSTAVNLGPLKLRELDPLAPIETKNKSEWLKLKPRLSGICGSDLSTLSGNSSRYFEPLTSFPFIMGHEIVADISDSNKRVVVDAVLGHQARGLPLPMLQTKIMDT